MPHFTHRGTVPTSVRLPVTLAIVVLAPKRAASRADTLSNRTFAEVKWAHFPRPHEGQPLESRPLSRRISDVANTLGSPCHGPIHASDHWIWRSARNRGWLRTLPDVQSSHSKTDFAEVSEYRS